MSGSLRLFSRLIPKRWRPNRAVPLSYWISLLVLLAWVLLVIPLLFLVLFWIPPSFGPIAKLGKLLDSYPHRFQLALTLVSGFILSVSGLAAGWFLRRSDFAARLKALADIALNEVSMNGGVVKDFGAITLIKDSHGLAGETGPTAGERTAVMNVAKALRDGLEVDACKSFLSAVNWHVSSGDLSVRYRRRFQDVSKKYDCTTRVLDTLSRVIVGLQAELPEAVLSEDDIDQLTSDLTTIAGAGDQGLPFR